MIAPVILSLTLAAAAPPSVPLTSARRIVVAGRLLRIGDVVAGEAIAPAARRRPIARLPVSGPVTLSRQALARLIRRVVPGIRLTGDDAMMLTLVARPSPTTSGGRCRALRRDVARGEPVTGDMADEVTCDDRLVRPAFDRHSAGGVAAGDLPAGTYLGRVALRPPPAVRKGTTMALVSSAGPVRIERQVIAMQDSRGGGIFVRDADGQVFAAPLAGDVVATGGGER